MQGEQRTVKLYKGKRVEYCINKGCRYSLLLSKQNEEGKKGENKMNIRIDTPISEPIIYVDNEPVSYLEGIKAILRFKDWSRDDMAHHLSVSSRTVNGWIIGRKPSRTVLTLLSVLIKR